MHRKREKKEYIVHNVDTAFEILFLISHNGNLTFKEIESKIKASSSQLKKIINILVSRDYLTFNKKKKTYSLGIKNFEVGYSYLSHVEIRKLAKPFLIELGELVKENVYLAIRSAWEIVYIDAFEVDRPVTVKSRVGKLLPLYASASGKVMLAYMDEEELEEFFSEVKMIPYTKKTITDREKLINHLKRVRDWGFAIDNEEWEYEVKCISVPVWDYTGKVVAAITLSAPSYRLPKERILELKDIFKEKAEQLSEKLGYSKELVYEG